MQATSLLQSHFGSNLTAVYLFGSAAAGGLRPQSDVDLLAVVERPMTAASRRTLVGKLMETSGRYPVAPGGPHPLEVTAFLRRDLDHLVHPTRSELVYGEWLMADFKAGKPAGPVSYPDLTLLLAQARRQARTLFGPPASDVLPTIPAAGISRAISDSLPDLLASLAGDERNGLLTLVRMWRTLTTGEFVAKDAAAEWAIPRIPPEIASLVAQARDAYLGLAPNDWRSRPGEAEETARYLAQRITAALA